MLEKLKSFAKSIAKAPEPLNTAKFNDPLANTISWDPVVRGGSNFKTHKYHSDGFNRAEFKMSIGARIFTFIFMIVGLAVPTLILSTAEFQDTKDMFFVAGFGFIFFAAGSFMYYHYGKPVVFDKMKGFYWKGWKKPDHTTERVATKSLAPINDVYALQLIKEFVRSDKSSYYSYELNLVLKDGTRINVVDHGNGNILRNDAQQLSSFLGKPLWDAT
ncbi:MAG: hypothetical protein JJU37_01950 [Balneolaceae bacterium]|nr:hypothetical protein [Balneolaceae bacterium]